MIEVVPATLDHAARLAPIMRAEDQIELRALDMTPVEALTHSVNGSFIAEAAVFPDGRVLAMWGACAAALTDSKAYLWMLGSRDIPNNKKVLLRGSRSFVAHMHRTHALLECMVDNRYKQAVRWVRWMGFEPVGSFDVTDTRFTVFHKRG